MQQPEKKPTPVNDFYLALFDIEFAVRDVEAAKSALAEEKQRLENKIKDLATLYIAAATVAHDAGQELPDQILCGTALVRFDEEGGVSVERVDAVERGRLLGIADKLGEVREKP
ncbi:hypothetical protein D9M71_81000 [compost metagenome]